jgi:hypothetical protein
MISSKQKSMMILHWEIITNALLVELPCPRFTIMWRVMKKVIDLKTNTRKLINLRKVKATARTWRISPKVKGKARARYLHAINVVVQTTLPENAYEAHFNNMAKEASTSKTIPSNPKMPKLTDTDDMDMENTIVKYHSNDVYGDLK